jgi:hypothetical protein
MAEILSQEELLADLKEFGELVSAKRRPLKAVPPTERGYDAILKLWTK